MYLYTAVCSTTARLAYISMLPTVWLGNSAPTLQVTLKLWQEDPWVQKEELRDFCASLMSFTQDLEQNVHTCKDNSHKYNATQLILFTDMT